MRISNFIGEEQASRIDRFCQIIDIASQKESPAVRATGPVEGRAAPPSAEDEGGAVTMHTKAQILSQHSDMDQ